MQVCLVSHDAEIQKLLEQCVEITWISVVPGAPVPEANLYIWDFGQNFEIPDQILRREEAQHLLLIDAKHLEGLNAHLQGSVTIILRPATPFTIKAFIEMATKAWSLRNQAREADTLRHDRDALLQYVLEVNLRLQQYDQERSNFLARALHDLRAPLTALHGYCGLLAEGRLGPINARQRELLERMSHSTSRLGRLASGAFELLMQGRVEKKPRFADEDIEECVNRALHDVYPLFQDKEIEVNVHMEQPEQPFLFEAEQIEQVLVNLLENSCKFTQRGGMVEVCGYPTVWEFGRDPFGGPQPLVMAPANSYRIDVADNGAGVPEHLAEKIFEQYASYSGSLDRSGGGLGLAICKRIVAAHGGVIWATPSKDGGRFSFVLPLGALSADGVSLSLSMPDEYNVAACGEAN